MAKLVSLFFICGLGFAQAQGLTKSASAVVTTPHVRAELLVFAPEGVQSGKPITVGLQIQHQPGWHTYWKNPGDSGLPTQLTWTLPAGIEAGEIAWPTPKKIPVAQLVNYGYEGQIVLTVPLQVGSTFQAVGSDTLLRLKAQWLVCKTECIPEEGEFALKLPIRGATAASRALFESAKQSMPELHSGAASFTPIDKSIKFSVTGLPSAWQGKQLEAFPEGAELIETAAKQEQAWAGGIWSTTIPMHAQRSTSPSKMVWLVKIAGGQSNPARIVSANLEGAWPASAAAKPTAASPALTAALAKNAADQALPVASPSWMSTAFWLAVAGAVLGGLILNLMPCVLPVLAIKILSFAPQKIQSSSASVAKIKIDTTGDAVVESDHALSLRGANALFALGVVGTFVLMGVLLLGLRSAGQTLGWGFQLQSPAMVMALAVLFLFVGLNLFGAFELRTLLPASLANFKSHSPAVEAVASGVLAVLVATPCTAPFMGASLGLAITLPILQGLLIFAALGFGMALPFVAMALVPALGLWLLKALPKPGVWMDVLRRGLAWPIFATVIWLMWVYALQTSVNSAFIAMLALLLMLALVWALHLQSVRAKWSLSVLFALLLAGTLLLPAATTSTAAQAAQESDWQPWSAAAQKAAKDAGQPVFVDFTAAWCITCQVNKSAVLTQPSVMAQLKAKKVLLLRADWTKPDAAIAAELLKLGRTGLPVYAFYLPGSQAPQLLPEVLTTGAIESILAVL